MFLLIPIIAVYLVIGFILSTVLCGKSEDVLEPDEFDYGLIGVFAIGVILIWPLVVMAFGFIRMSKGINRLIIRFGKFIDEISVRKVDKE